MLKSEEHRNVIHAVLAELDAGRLRCAEPTENGWQVNDWVKKAVILYFPIREMKTIHMPPFEYHDKMELKGDFVRQGVRVIPPATARYGAYLAPGVVMMPSYVNIRANVDSGT